MTKPNKVSGFITDGNSVSAAEVKCRLTTGKKEVISFEANGIMIGANYEEVEKVIEKIRRKKHGAKEHGHRNHNTRKI